MSSYDNSYHLNVTFIGNLSSLFQETINDSYRSRRLLEDIQLQQL